MHVFVYESTYVLFVLFFGILIFISVFDLLKNERQDMTTLVVQCLICKTVSKAE